MSKAYLTIEDNINFGHKHDSSFHQHKETHNIVYNIKKRWALKLKFTLQSVTYNRSLYVFIMLSTKDSKEPSSWLTFNRSLYVFIMLSTKDSKEPFKLTYI